MINEKKFSIITDEKIENQVIEYRDKLKTQYKKMTTARNTRIRAANAAKKKAEQSFPAAMEEIEKKITAAFEKGAFEKGANDTRYNCGRGTTGIYLLYMLLQALPLSGFECIPDYDTYNNGHSITVKW